MRAWLAALTREGVISARIPRAAGACCRRRVEPGMGDSLRRAARARVDLVLLLFEGLSHGVHELAVVSERRPGFWKILLCKMFDQRNGGRCPRDCKHAIDQGYRRSVGSAR